MFYPNSMILGHILFNYYYFIFARSMYMVLHIIVSNNGTKGIVGTRHGHYFGFMIYFKLVTTSHSVIVSPNENIVPFGKN